MKNWKEYIYIIIGTSFGLGYTPIAPGTAGALPGLGAYIIIALFTSGLLQTVLIAFFFVLSCGITIWLSPWAENYWKKKDPGIFVTDEIAGFLGTVLLWRSPSIAKTAIWAFLITRIIDIIKIPPARQLERLNGGWGILADDLCSSLYAVALLYLGSHFFPEMFGLV
jgi:phosphatidylglycerophosphatase A